MNEVIKAAEKVLYLILKTLPVVLLVGFICLMCMAVTPLVVYVVKIVLYICIPVAACYYGYKYFRVVQEKFQKVNDALDRLTKEDTND
jgi:membrane protein implicated in regulation of membrane protease activity